MKKRLYFSVCTLVLSVCLILGTTYALFTDHISYDNNSVTTASVNVSGALYDTNDLNSKLDNINISNMTSGDTKEYVLNVDNNSTTDISYRMIFDFSSEVQLLEYIEIDIIDNDITNNVSFDGTRGVSPWTRDKGCSDFSLFIIIKLNSIPNELQNKTLNFDFKLDAVQNNFIKVSNQSELDKVVSGDYVIIDNTASFKNIIIRKDIYLDLAGTKVNNISVVGEDISNVELVNGKTYYLQVDASNATVHCYISILSSANLNTDNHSFNYYSNETNDVKFNVEGGSVFIDSKANISIEVSNAKENSNPVSINFSNNTNISSLIVADSAHKNVTIYDISKISNVEVSDEIDVQLEGDTSNLEINQNISFVSNNNEDYYISKDNGIIYKNYPISLEDALKIGNEIYIQEGTYLIDKEIVLNKHTKLVGLGDVVFEKAVANFTSNSLLTIDGVDVTISNITFKDHDSSNNASSAVSTTIGDSNIEITNCTFENFPKNGLTIRGGIALVQSNTFIYGGKEGSAGNAIQLDYNVDATIIGNKIEHFENFSTKWSTTGILLLRGANALISGNTFNDCYAAIVVTEHYDFTNGIQYDSATYTEEDNNFKNCTFDKRLETYTEYIVSNTEKVSFSEYVDGVYTTYKTTKVYTVINDALQEAEDYSTIYILSGEYNVEVYNNNKAYSNLLIQKPITIKGVGEVHLVTTLPANSIGTYQQTIRIDSSDVTLDNLHVHETSNTNDNGSTANKTIEFMKGDNITVQNCTLYNDKAGSFYVASTNVKDYYILNNTTVGDSDIAISITNGAGNESETFGKSKLEGNTFTGALFLTGKRYNAWNLEDIENLPSIKNNTFGGYETSYTKDEEEVFCIQFIRVVSINEDKLIANDVCLEIIDNNTFLLEDGKTLENISYETQSLVYNKTDWPHTPEDETTEYIGTTYTKYFGYII